MTKKELINAAKMTMENAYSPYSQFKVGAAVITKSGKIYTGVNIENVSFGATICAERVALFKAISEGEKEFEMLAIVSSSGDVTYPCGICRQVIVEHMRNGNIVFEDIKGNISELAVQEMMPFSFDEVTLKK
ncbi:cytidine deaminase [Clostridiaceae bacterium M8S5]|nr:cytidine deaminase [Clostridiaceae bacterium M8S5]